MKNGTSPCPEQSALMRAAAGELELHDLDILTEHLDGCAACQARFDDLLLCDSAAFIPAENMPAIFDNGLARLLERMKRANHWEDQSLSGTRLKVIRKLGQGGMGEVFECFDRNLNRNVAIKKIRPDHLTPNLLERLEREARIQAGLNHPNIVQIYEIGLIACVPFIAMELVPGGSLQQLLGQKPLAPRMAAALIAKVARAVQHAHESGVLHRDIKPSNILLMESNLTHDSRSGLIPTPKIADFGLAKSMYDSEELSKSNQVVGTPAYISPEQATGGVVLNNASDIYSLGVVLYECLTGHPPFNANSVGMLLMMVESMVPVSPRKLVPGISKDLQTICLKCLEKVPARRYRTAGELADDLQRYLQGEAIQARPAGLTRRLWGWSRRNKSLAGAVSAVICLTLALLGGMVLFGLKQAELRNIAESESQRSRKMAEKAELATEKARQLFIKSIGQLSNITAQRVTPPKNDAELRQVIESEIKTFNYQIDLFIKDDEMLKNHTTEAAMYLLHSAQLSRYVKDEARFVQCLERIIAFSMMPSHRKSPETTIQFMAYQMLARHYEEKGDFVKVMETWKRCWVWIRSFDKTRLAAEMQLGQDAATCAGKYQDWLRRLGCHGEADRVAAESESIRGH